jgi:hypothetical protein
MHMTSIAVEFYFKRNDEGKYGQDGFIWIRLVGGSFRQAFWASFELAGRSNFVMKKIIIYYDYI